jgi:hypothetical protein
MFHRLAHKSNAQKPDYHPGCIGPPTRPSKPDIPPDQRWRIPMKNLILAAFAALSLSAAIAPLASAQSLSHGWTGTYDNTANSLNRNTIGGQ